MLGKSWMMASYKEYLQYIPQIKASKKDILALKKKHHSELEVQDIIDLINTSVANKTVVSL